MNDRTTKNANASAMVFSFLVRGGLCKGRGLVGLKVCIPRSMVKNKIKLGGDEPRIVRREKIK